MKEIKAGETVLVTDADGNKYELRVKAIRRLDGYASTPGGVKADGAVSLCFFGRTDDQ